MSEAIRKIIIAGGGTAGWITAAALRAGLAANVEILLIESEDIATIGVGEATIPTIRVFNEHVGIDEISFIRATNATFKLGIEFVGWGHEGNRYFHPFGDYGGTHEGIAAHQIWRRLNQAGEVTPLEAYSVGTQLAYAGKFFPPNPDPRSPMHDYSYAFQFDAGLYARFLREHCEKRGVSRINAKITGVNLRSENGYIDSLTLDDGRFEAADLFIDCTGFRALLLGEALGVPFVDWSKWLPVDRAWAVATSKPASPHMTPFTRSTALEAGWQWRIPLQHRTGNGHVFCSSYIDEQAALDTLLQNLDAPPLKEPRLLRFKTGHRQVYWEKNCVAIGLSTGFLEPLESTSINFIQNSAVRLLELFPSKRIDPYLRDEYNLRNQGSYDFVRDFIIAHYCLNDRSGELWRYCANMPIPDDLQWKLELYKRRGEVLVRKFDHFHEPSWISIYHGHGLRAEAYDPLADRIPLEGLSEIMRKRRDQIRQLVAKLPRHEDFIAKHCASEAALPNPHGCRSISASA
ncbi:tryptophan 7-halogenase [Asticcacaulis sp. EMRT-3]|uniref:tryptophan halogenase family protein n=1 Tax=Asticcacaulis sp. EMRT-3 TaxID=3040349 RepID=UPI0024AF1696|nr:tryptophan 7-halogenase [Asticcacaulis sp. EMRT-3]MDI7776462.1 tryptophan 7-halogenase [Asticcacaulis sp. EMRT-3]